MAETQDLQKSEGVIIRLPSSICQQLSILEGDALEIIVENGQAILKKVGTYTAPVVKVHNRCSVVPG